MRTAEEMTEVFFLVAVKEPIPCVRTRIKWLDQAKIAIDADQEHRAVDAVAFDVCRMMIRCSDPIARPPWVETAPKIVAIVIEPIEILPPLDVAFDVWHRI